MPEPENTPVDILPAGESTLKSGQNGQMPSHPLPVAAEKPPFIHPVSALVLMAIDWLWTLAEWKIITLVVTIPLSFITVGVATSLIQRFVNHDTVGKSIAVGFLLGVLAAIPSPITGTFVGVLVLTLSGLKKK